MSLADPPHEDASRISRSLLSSTSSIPNELVAKYDIPDNCHVHKTVFRDKTLPHYQAKLLGGRVFDGKRLLSIQAFVHVLCMPCVHVPDTKAVNECIVQPCSSDDGHRREKGNNKIAAGDEEIRRASLLHVCELASKGCCSWETAKSLMLLRSGEKDARESRAVDGPA